MTWIELTALLEREIQQARARLATQDATKMKLLDGSEDAMEQQEIENETDLACEVFAAERRWPITRPKVAVPLIERLEHCLLFARFVADPAVPQKLPGYPVSKIDLLRWVLIDYWHAAGRPRYFHRINLAE